MESVLLQELATLSGRDGIANIVQSAHQYLDIGQNEDLVFYIDVRDLSPTSGNLSIVYETSPTAQDSSFLGMLAPLVLKTAGVRADRAAFSTAAVPPARFVRWRLQCSGGPWNVTFRIWVAAYSYS